MTETLTVKQVLALLAQDEPPDIEYLDHVTGKWKKAHINDWCISEWRTTFLKFHLKPEPQRRLSVTLANGEVVSWPEPVREALKYGQGYWIVEDGGSVEVCEWTNHSLDKELLTFGNVHLTREAAQEHADALRKINTQGATC